MAPLFASARAETADSILSAMRCDPVAADSRASAARALTKFNRRIFLRIAIADLTGRIKVESTMLLMSRLADECIRAAYELALRFAGPRAHEAGQFCVLAMGKLGASELNLSSDIDLVYIFDPPAPGEGSIAAARIGEIITELLDGGCFRIDMRLRPGGRNSPLAVPAEGALNFYQSYGQTWERAALLRARPVAGSIELGRDLLLGLRRFVYRSYLDFDTLRQLRAMKHLVEAESALARLDRAQHQTRTRRDSRARIHRAGAHADLWRPRSPHSHRKDHRCTRFARQLRISARRARASTGRGLSLPAQCRTQVAGRLRPPDPYAAAR